MKRLSLKFEFCVESGEIAGPNGRETLEPQAMAVLTCLADEPGRLWTRDELLDEAWQGRVVSDATLSASISRIRKAMRHVGADDISIDTRSRRGYVLRIADADVPAPSPRMLRSNDWFRVLSAGLATSLLIAIVLHFSGVAPWQAGEERNFIKLSFDINSTAGMKESPVLIVRNGEEGEIRVFETDPLLIRVRAQRESARTVLLEFELGGFSHWGRFVQRVPLGELSHLEMQASAHDAKFQVAYLAEAVGQP